MAADLQSLIESTFRTAFPKVDLHCILSSSLHRMELRKQLVQTLGVPNHDVSRDKLLDLNLIPRHYNGRSVSLSHCPSLSGFLIAAKSCGFDIEETARLTEAPVRRVSKPEEFKAAPSAGVLWSAKEAAFKALNQGSEDIKVLSHLEIFDWKKAPFSSQAWFFHVKNPLNDTPCHGWGCLVEEKGLIFSAFLESP